MLHMSLTLEQAMSGDLPAIRTLLASAALPVEDLGTAPIRFWVARNGRELIGVVGLETCGAAGLLRSLVVTSAERGKGMGRSLVSALERESKASGVMSLVLLTQTAERFFSALGYRVVDRASVGDAIQKSAEFRSLCPSSAVCMTKRISSLDSV